MSNTASRHRLEGLEPDNLLAFLALLGLLRALETSRPNWVPRAAWDLDQPPPRPILTMAKPVSQEMICDAAVEGVARLVSNIDFGSATDLKLNVKAARSLCGAASVGGGYFAELCAALICDAATDPEQAKVEPTPLAYPSVATSNFLKNFLVLSKTELPEKQGRGRDASYPKSAAECIEQTLFAPWQRLDRPVGLRWDPDEAKRHAYRWRAPTDDPPKTQHGANRLAMVGLSALTCAPSISGNRVQLSVIGGEGLGDRFSLAWPIWTTPASLSAIRALLSHPKLREPRALQHLAVDHVRVTRRISLDRLRNFTYAEPLEGGKITGFQSPG
jgi:hypothetical protein